MASKTVNIDNVLQLTGEDAKLRDLLMKRLIDCGWESDIKAACTKLINEQGLDKVSVESLVTALTPIGREKIPSEVKKELLDEIRRALMKSSDT